MNKTHIYIVVAVLALGLIVGIYFYIKPSFTDKAIAVFIEFNEYFITTYEKLLKDSKSNLSDDYRTRKIDSLPELKENMLTMADDLNNDDGKSSKEEIYNEVVLYIKGYQNMLIEFTDKNFVRDINIKADDLLKKLNKMLLQ